MPHNPLSFQGVGTHKSCNVQDCKCHQEPQLPIIINTCHLQIRENSLNYFYLHLIRTFYVWVSLKVLWLWLNTNCNKVPNSRKSYPHIISYRWGRGWSFWWAFRWLVIWSLTTFPCFLFYITIIKKIDYSLHQPEWMRKGL